MALVGSVTLVGSETLAVATVMPAVARDLGRGGYGLAFSLFSVASIVGVLVAGPAADRRGPWAPFALGMALFGLGLAVGAAAPSVAVLLAGRVLQGLGAGAIPAIGYACIGRAYPESARPRMLAVLSTAWVLPGIAGPGLAGIVASEFGWRWVFGGLLPLVVLAAALGWQPLRALTPAPQAPRTMVAAASDAAAVVRPAGLPATLDAEPGTGAGDRAAPAAANPRMLDAVRFAGGVGLLISAADLLQPFGVRNAAGSAAALLGGVALARGPARRLLPDGWWRAAPGLPAAVVARAMVAYGFVAVDAFIPLVLTEVRGFSLTTASVAVSLGTLVWSVGAWIADRLVARVGAPRLAAVGAALVSGGVLAQTTLLGTTVPVAVGIGGVAVAALGMGVALTPLSLLVLEAADPTPSASDGDGHGCVAGRPEGAGPGVGVVSSWLSLFELLGFALGPVLGGALVAAAPQQPQLGRTLVVGFLVAATVAAGAALLKPRLKLAATRDPGPPGR
ncbi:MAG: MFS transporter [Acidimicrobiales bacterium]